MKKANLFKRINEHFDSDPARLPVISQDIEVYERPNLHLATQELLSGKDDIELVGIVEFDYDVSLAKLSRKSSAKDFDEGPIEYIDVSLAGNEKLACVKQALYFFQDDGHAITMLIAAQQHSYPPKIKVEVMGADREVAESFLRRLIEMTRQGKAYRGHVLSLERDCYGGVVVKFHTLPTINRDEIILPEDVLRRVEQQTINFSQNVDRLRQAGRHIKRGILLHGPPGTGKTLSAMYLAARMPERTVLLITGAGMGSIETACTLARMLQPTTVVLEDVDLIGTQREHQMVDANALLFELLNQMDGLSDDADILFILTTNRPDILEPALSARPGRIDQAIEIPLPDKDCRRRLMELYGRGLKIDSSRWDILDERTEGTSAAFIREMLRKAALIAAVEQNGDSIQVDGRHLDEALTELLVTGGALTKSLLGASSAGSDGE